MKKNKSKKFYVRIYIRKKKVIHVYWNKKDIMHQCTLLDSRYDINYDRDEMILTVRGVCV